MRQQLSAAAIAVPLLLALPFPPLVAQQPDTAAGAAAAMSAAFEHELAERRHEAAAAYLLAMRRGGDTIQAVLGIERVYADLGWTDSMAPLLSVILSNRPRDATIRSVQLRSLRMGGQPEAARTAFEAWVQLDRTDGTPYRIYSRLLLDAGETAAADTVLRRAREALGGTGTIALELAQARAAMGLWRPSAESWRQALERDPYLSDAAAFALAPTPVEFRPEVSAVLLAPPMEPAARRALASLQMSWGDPPAAWQALRSLPPSDSVVDHWVSFAESAEALGVWSVAREAYTAALAVQPTLGLAARAGNAALHSGDPAAALAAVDRVDNRLEPGAWAQLVLPVRVRALASLGRAEEAERAVARSAADSATRALLQREVANAWVRSGNVERARVALDAGGAAADDEVRGWLALYEGDLAGAREGLRHAREQDVRTVLARSVLSRTRAERAPLAGSAFLLLARGDSAAAGAALEAAAGELPETESLFLTAAARYHAAVGRTDLAERIWAAVVRDHAHSAEAPEAALAWATRLMAAGDTAAATARLEHLILTWPGSALVPQARRALDQARGRSSIPPATPAWKEEY